MCRSLVWEQSTRLPDETTGGSQGVGKPSSWYLVPSAFPLSPLSLRLSL